MKKRLFLFPALLAVLLLSGCTRELNGAGLALSFPEETVQFTGTVSKGTYTGAVTGDGWRFDGTLTAERLLTGGELVPSPSGSPPGTEPLVTAFILAIGALWLTVGVFALHALSRRKVTTRAAA